jgi:hypothetical protein
LTKYFRQDRHLSSIRQDLISYAIDTLTKHPKTAEVEKRLESFLTNKQIRSTITWKASMKLLDLGFMAVYEEVFGTLSKAFKETYDFAKTLEAMKLAEVSLLTKILKATRQTSILSRSILPEDMHALGTILSYLNVYARPAGELWTFLEEADNDASDAVLRASIEITGVNPICLALEINSLLQELVKEENSNQHPTGDVPRFPVKPNYTQPLQRDISVNLLVRALEHPSDSIGENAVDILQNCFDSSVVAEPLKTLLSTTEDKVLYRIALLADQVWKGEAAQILLKWLDNLPHPNKWFLAVLPDLEGARNDARTFHHLFRGLLSTDATMATYAVRVLKEISDAELQNHVSKLQIALDRWAEIEREDERRHALSDEKVRTIPPNPVNDLLNNGSGLRLTDTR